jgi:FG-GAP-like repeat/PASTA domain
VRTRPGSVLLASIAVALAVSAVAGSSNDRAPSFAATKNYASGEALQFFAVADLNGDGKPELVTTNGDDDTVSVLRNRGNGSFASRRNYATGFGPGPLAIADLNGDGKPDLVAADKQSSTVSVLLNRGDGSFEANHDYATGRGPDSLALADLNGDSQPDLATANSGADTVSVLLNTGDASFLPRVDYRVGGQPSGIGVADLNGDGKPDLVSVGFTLSVLLNRGDGSFSPRVDYRTFPSSLAIADLNRDGRPDLAVTHEESNTVSVLLNRGDGSFSPRVDYRTGRGRFSQASALAIADLNRDGRPELAVANAEAAVANSDADTVSVFINRGNGRFAPRHNYATPELPSSIAIADLNGDGRPELAVASTGATLFGMTENDTGVSVLINRGNGSFLPRVDYRIGGGSPSLAIADLNGDGRPDLAVATEEDNVSVLINTPGLCNVQAVVRMRLPAAKVKLARANCRVGKLSRAYSKSVKKGRVISQKPKLGAVLRNVGKVSLVISRGSRRS